MAKKGGGGIWDFALSIPIIYDNSAADAAVKTTDAAVDATGKKLEAHQMKLRQLWAYGNQMVSLILNLTRQAVKGTQQEAKVVELLSIAQFAQGEYAVGITVKQAAAAYASGNIFQGVVLSAIATSMQVMNIVAMANRENARVLKREADQLKAYVDQYRS